MNNWQGHWPQAAQMYRLLGILDHGQTIPQDMHGLYFANINGRTYRFRLFPTGKGICPRKRLFVNCPDCGALVEFGHYSQHRHSMACNEGTTLRRTTRLVAREIWEGHNKV